MRVCSGSTAVDHEQLRNLDSITLTTPHTKPSSGGGTLFFCGLLVAAAAIGFFLIRRTDSSVSKSVVVHDAMKIHESNAHALHNVYRLGQTLYTGSAPDEEGAFDSLTRLGIKTVISVDGASPDVEAARSHGMRYVHLPITYSSVPHETLIELMRVSRELPGPIYLHCHHGKHRGPAAAVSLWRCLDKSVTAEQAVAALKMIGTADRYQGLYASVQGLACPTAAELKESKSELPETSPVPPLAKSMSEIDRIWDRVKTPTSDRDATTIGLQLTTTYDLAEILREAARLADVTEDMQPGFQAVVDDLETLADMIKTELRDPAKPNPQRAEAVARVTMRCDQCHARFRD
jgi:protein tyrosine phosphatase (PTP) superfamily phosphohydrolase (DUF442 family)